MGLIKRFHQTKHTDQGLGLTLRHAPKPSQLLKAWLLGAALRSTCPCCPTMLPRRACDRRQAANSVFRDIDQVRIPASVDYA